MMRGIGQVPARRIILSWRGVGDVVPHVPASGTAWDLPETHRAWWRGIRHVLALFAINVVCGLWFYVVKTWDGSWTDTVVGLVVSLCVIGAIYALVRARLWWLLRSRPWQMWHGTPARPSSRLGKAPAVIRVNGLRPDGSTVTALLRASRWEAEPNASLGAFGPLLVLRGGSGLALVAVPGEQGRIRVARLPLTVREHDRWEEAFNEWLTNSGDG